MLEPRAARRERSSVSARAAACARVRVVRPRGRERAHIFRKRWFSSWRRRRRRVGASGDSSVCSDLKKVASPTAARKSARRHASPPLRGARPGALREALPRRQAARMGGDGAANAEVSGSEREGERGRSDARVEPASFSVGNAEGPEADVPPGLWQFAGKKLREAYFHAARASVRDLELNPRPARDEDRAAADPPDPEPGVRRVLSAIRDLAVASARVPAANDEDQTRDASNPKRRKKKETRARSSVCARFDADAKAAARRARADWRARRRRFSSTTFPKTFSKNATRRRRRRRTEEKTKPRDGRSRDARFSRTSRVPPRASAERSGARRPSREGTAT